MARAMARARVRIRVRVGVRVGVRARACWRGSRVPRTFSRRTARGLQPASRRTTSKNSWPFSSSSPPAEQEIQLSRPAVWSQLQSCWGWILTPDRKAVLPDQNPSASTAAAGVGEGLTGETADQQIVPRELRRCKPPHIACRVAGGIRAPSLSTLSSSGVASADGRAEGWEFETLPIHLPAGCAGPQASCRGTWPGRTGSTQTRRRSARRALPVRCGSLRPQRRARRT